MRLDVTGFVTFIGVDLHKCSVTLRAVRADGELLGHLTCNTKCIERIAEWITNLPGPKWLAVEACPFVEWFIDRFTPCVDRMDIADPQLMQLRKFGRHWRQLSRSLAKAKQGMKSMLNAANIRGPQFDGPRAHHWFLTFGGLLQPAQRLAFGNYLHQILLIERQREILRREMFTAARSPQCAATEQLLRSVPGRTQSGNITKAGSATLRQALCQAAVTLCQSDAKQEATRQRFIARMPNAKANVIMGRRLLRTLYAMVRDQAPYQGGERRYRTKAANKAKATRRARTLQPA